MLADDTEWLRELAARRRELAGRPLPEQLDALLPQTQCTQCGYDGCRPYAAALAAGEADINRCPPGGPATIQALAELLRRAPKPLDPACGEHKPRTIAWIDEAACIGCTLCIQACPVDAIAGSNKLMHTVIAAECTGCELCLPPCPVDCIELEPDPIAANQRLQRADLARRRHRARQQRLARQQAEREAGRQRQKATLAGTGSGTDKKAAIAAALARAKQKKRPVGGP